MLFHKLLLSSKASNGPTGAVSFLSSSASAQFTSSANVTKPSGVGLNNLMIAFYAHNSSTDPLLRAPAGWTQVINQTSGAGSWLGVFYKLGGSSEPSTYTFSSSEGSNQRVAILAFSGGTGLVDAIGTLTGVSGTSVSAASVSFGAGTGFGLAFSSAEGGSQSLSSGPITWTQIYVSDTAAPNITVYSKSDSFSPTASASFSWGQSSALQAVQLFLLDN